MPGWRLCKSMWRVTIYRVISNFRILRGLGQWCDLESGLLLCGLLRSGQWAKTWVRKRKIARDHKVKFPVTQSIREMNVPNCMRGFQYPIMNWLVLSGIDSTGNIFHSDLCRLQFVGIIKI